MLLTLFSELTIELLLVLLQQKSPRQRESWRTLEVKNGAEGSGLIAETFYSVHPLTIQYFGM